MPTGPPSATRERNAALRLSTSRRLASLGVARQTMHQQLFGPPRDSNKRSRSRQLSRPTARNVRRSLAIAGQAAQQQRPPPGAAGFKIDAALEGEAAERVGGKDVRRLLDQQTAQHHAAAR